MMSRIISAKLPGPWNVVNRAASKTLLWANVARRHLATQVVGESPLETLQDLVVTQWDRLNQSDLLPWIGNHTKRLYVYSESDTVVPASMVKDHLGEARQKGLDVSELVFKDTSHALHAHKYPERYWTEVLRTWNDASTFGQREV